MILIKKAGPWSTINIVRSNITMAPTSGSVNFRFPSKRQSGRQTDLDGNLTALVVQLYKVDHIAADSCVLAVES